MAMGAACSLTQQRDKMIGALECALELNPSFTAAHSMLGTFLAMAGRHEDAIAHLEKAVRLNPRDPFNWLSFYGMGMAHFAAGHYEESVLAIAYRCLAASYACLGRDDEARTALQAVLRFQPEISVGLVRLTLSSADPAFSERYIDGLRKAGLKE
jgi:adenylate cyclase